MNQYQTILSARIELRQIHLREWQTLSTNQQAVWKVNRQQAANDQLLFCDDPVACLSLRRQATARHSQLLRSQREIREQMKLRHRQAMDALQ